MPLIIGFTADELCARAPAILERKLFGGNQLLDGSISLSPPYTQVRTNDLPRQYRCGPSTRSFLWLPPLRHSSPSSVPDTVFAHSNRFSEDQRSVDAATPSGEHRTGSNGDGPLASAGSAQLSKHAGGAALVRHGSDGDGRSRIIDLPGLWPPPQSRAESAPRARSRGPALVRFHIRPGRIAGPSPAFPPDNFKQLFGLFFKVLFHLSPRSGIVRLSVFARILGLADWNFTDPMGAAFPTNRLADSASWCRTGSGHDAGSHPLRRPLQGTGHRSAAGGRSPDVTIADSEAPDFSSWAIPGLRSRRY
ncbi:UNVERIFIED_CONTAM: hypothetical protein Sradi_0717700 [Sesamum radiatum]|uniref:Uncharacterized protein n=1 Tax=Sesamum radiatum TaxID=300843 RepID=A0AAW2VN58_SESRA